MGFFDKKPEPTLPTDPNPEVTAAIVVLKKAVLEGVFITRSGNPVGQVAITSEGLILDTGYFSRYYGSMAFPSDFIITVRSRESALKEKLSRKKEQLDRANATIAANQAIIDTAKRELEELNRALNGSK